MQLLSFSVTASGRALAREKFCSAYFIRTSIAPWISGEILRRNQGTLAFPNQVAGLHFRETTPDAGYRI